MQNKAERGNSMQKYASWQVFLIGVGFLFIVLSQQVSQPMVMIIGGLLIVLFGVILLKRSAKKERRRNGKW